MTCIAPTAVVDPAARIGADCEIGPGCYVGPKVTLGDGCRLLPNVCLLGCTTVGRGNVFYPGAIIGAAPQDLKYRGTDTKLLIGDENVFREHVTVHPGTETGGGVTRIGSHNQFQVGSHIAHDTRVGDHCILSNTVQVAGHVAIEDYVNISGLVGIQQFVTLGKYCFIAGATRCTRDVPPFLKFSGFDGVIAGVNEGGLRRWGFDDAQIGKITRLYKVLFSKKAERTGDTLADRIRSAESNGALSDNEHYLLTFVKRSLLDGVWGRYLESHRNDGGQPPPDFYGR